MAWRRRSDVVARFEKQSVAENRVGGDVALVQQVIVDGRSPEDRAVRLLAESVDRQLSAEVQRQQLERPAPIVLRVRETERPVGPLPGAVSGEVRLDGDTTRMVDLFQGLPDRQLVILGEPGAGKSVQATLLAHGLLRAREPDGPVPVLFQMSSWRPHTMPLEAWMEKRLLEDHPLLGDQEMARRLVQGRRVLPVLDGLDEITAESFRDVIMKLDQALDRGTPFVLTCRAKQYEDAAVEFGQRLTRAPVIEIEPVQGDDAIRYLEGAVGDDERWRPVLDHLRAEPGGTLAEALTTPLMLFLARVAYSAPGSDPRALLSFTDPADVENHVLEAYLPGVYAEYLYPRYPERKARRWLATLASGPREIRWWNVSSRSAEFASWLLYALGTAWIVWLGWNIWFAIMAAVAVLVANGWFHVGLLLDKVEIVATEREAADPRSHLRRYGLFAALFSGVSGAAVGAAMGAWFGGASIDADSATARGYALAAGLLFGTATLISTAWGRYLLARCEFVLRGRLPVRLGAFIKDAGERGVLRRPGSVYQFRHARVQDVLRAEGPALLDDEPYTVLPPGTPRARQTAKLIAVPSLRLFAHACTVGVTLAVLGGVFAQVGVDFESGVKPRGGTNTYCLKDGCANVDYLSWSLPRGGSATTVFRPGSSFRNAPFDGLDGQVRISGCDDAEISMEVRAEGSSPRRRTITEGRWHGVRDWPLPASFEHLTVTFRRLDTMPCTARLVWERAGLTTNQYFQIKERL
ncbi:NACHT domain-containing protein [Actinomadura spongiicola]|uniref:NACHT domain-containing protein n=1 Tax=Actinomadura spongiicola TaxID=2303421 RepID=A0A372GIF3_9ACTN|nr:NACHT domain-containing protein [Actinomadura spongiicola]RFS84889.1 NACHT domain-containing protein [Actinomadura spongiicola]